MEILNRNISGALHNITVRFVCLLIFLAGIGMSQTASAASADDILQSCVKKLSGAKSLKATFTATFSGRSASGTLLSKGQKFSLVMSGIGSWYDGKNLWSYSAANNETTLWTPSKAELAESNPLLYLSSASDYTVKAGSGSKKGESIIVLTPKKRNSGIKSVTAVINTSTNLPKKLTIVAAGQTSVISFGSITLNPSIADSQFAYPKSKYPKVNVTDLR
ncbi:MAG: outer membrane lipoprotein carrier protein LolA [Muribaculaceae bacterium]|nr:outer membrane lipoprotein carrier protein LolA [Muribaculaceae bacterium]